MLGLDRINQPSSIESSSIDKIDKTQRRQSVEIDIKSKDTTKNTAPMILIGDDSHEESDHKSKPSAQKADKDVDKSPIAGSSD